MAFISPHHITPATPNPVEWAGLTIVKDVVFVTERTRYGVDVKTVSVIIFDAAGVRGEAVLLQFNPSQPPPLLQAVLDGLEVGELLTHIDRVELLFP
jgi:hypothetical protein